MGWSIIRTSRHQSNPSGVPTKVIAFIAVLLLLPAGLEAQQTTAIQKARDAYSRAQTLETALNDKAREDRTRDDYLKVINAYEQVYFITPHTPYADNCLVTIARLYEEIKEPKEAIRALDFLIREYPQTPFRNAAERDVARLYGVSEKKLSAITVDNIRFWESPDSVRVVIDLSGATEFKKGVAKSPNRAFIDISAARMNSMLKGKQMSVKSPLVQQIRAAQYDNATVRVVLDLGAASRIMASSLHDPDRLIVDIISTEPTPIPPTTITSAESKSAPDASSMPAPKVSSLPSKAPVKVAANDAKITPAKPMSNGDRSLIRSLGLKLQRVVIDAGHGGHDTGTIGPNGYEEKELVLDVSMRLKQLIQAELGADVIMTREDDTFVPLESRTSVANEQGGDLFISIHANSSSTKSVRGVETYYLNYTTSREALDVQTRENAASERSIHELQDLFRKILLSDKVDESRELAHFIQKSLAARKNAGVNRGVKPALFIVLIGANMPSVLAEISFISNPQEEKLLRTPEYRQQIAQSLFEGVRSYSESLSGLKSARTPEKSQKN